ncbi:hypothetical protein ACIGO8_28455 [Streptomyces sp. NPDC053493]|uniref:hypothetical protein n=1 Tax=Streptomyces sp. NPDC053493 TaxID=3365705 RepID=UPI0037D3F2FD
MTVVAVLLLPVLGLMLYAMDRIEDRLTGPPPKPARHARERHLRLVPPHRDPPAREEGRDAA